MLDREVPSDPAPPNMVGKMRKPTIVRIQKKTHSMKPKVQFAPKMKVAASNTKDLEKRLNLLADQKEKLESRTTKLSDELNKLKSEHDYIQQERDRLQQQWHLSRRQLTEEKESSLQLEKGIQRMKSHQAEQVTFLQQKMRSLMLNAKVQRVAFTQTENFPGGPLEDRESQTIEQVTKEKAAELLRQSDSLLAAFISELEKEKLNAESELKFAVVQLEQRMREETEAQISQLRDEKRKQLEEISILHMEQIRTVEGAHSEERAEMEGKIEFLQSELFAIRDNNETLSRNLEDSRDRLADKARLLGRAETQTAELQKEVITLREFKKDFQRDILLVERMKKEVKKYKDINEIIMGEFGKIEKERDGLILQLEQYMSQIGSINRMKRSDVDMRVRSYKDKNQ